MDSEQEWPQQVEEKFLQQEEQKEESIISIGHIYVAFSSMQIYVNRENKV